MAKQVFGSDVVYVQVDSNLKTNLSLLTEAGYTQELRVERRVVGDNTWAELIRLKEESEDRWREGHNVTLPEISNISILRLTTNRDSRSQSKANADGTIEIAFDDSYGDGDFDDLIVKISFSK